MLRVALKMLTGDRAKYTGLLFGIAFTSFLVTFAASYLSGFMTRGFALIAENGQADIWVMDPAVDSTEHLTNLPSSALDRVRSRRRAICRASGAWIRRGALSQWAVSYLSSDRR
jgi:putative ABC transport system permease protein